MQSEAKNFKFQDNAVPELRFTHEGGTQQFSFKSSGACFITIPEVYKTWISITKVEHRADESIVEVATTAYDGQVINEGSINLFCLDEQVEVSILQTPKYVIFKDRVFEEFVLEHFDKDGDGKISSEEAAQITEIDLSDYAERSRITSVEGIEYMPYLKTLMLNDCDDWGHYEDWEDISLTYLDVSHNQFLSILNCSWCGLTALDLSQTQH